MNYIKHQEKIVAKIALGVINNFKESKDQSIINLFIQNHQPIRKKIIHLSLKITLNILTVSNTKFYFNISLINQIKFHKLTSVIKNKLFTII